MIRTLPNGTTEHTPMTGDSYARAHGIMRALIAGARERGIEAVDLANAFLVFLAASVGTGKLDAGTIAATLAEIARAGVEATPNRGTGAATVRAAQILEFAAAIDKHVADQGVAALAGAARQLGRGGWAALVETADQIADRTCRGVVACPACRADKLDHAIADLERDAAAPPASN